MWICKKINELRTEYKNNKVRKEALQILKGNLNKKVEDKPVKKVVKKNEDNAWVKHCVIQHIEYKALLSPICLFKSLYKKYRIYKTRKEALKILKDPNHFVNKINERNEELIKELKLKFNNKIDYYKMIDEKMKKEASNKE